MNRLWLVWVALGVGGFCGVRLLAAEGETLVRAAEFFVAVDGSDAHDGSSALHAFATIQRGLDALQTGDTLTILPGEYFGPSSRRGLGGEAAQTRIRAAVPGTVLIRGDLTAPSFEPVETYPFVFVAPFAQPPTAVIEVDTYTVLRRQVEPAGVAFSPGSFFYDAERKRLYISTSNQQAPERHRYTVSVFDHSGLLLEDPRNVLLEGLAATGFFPADERGGRFEAHVSGLMMLRPVNSVMRNCVAFLNGNGLCLVRGQGNVIEQCVAYRNDSPFHLPSANIISFHGGNETIRDSLAYGSNEGGIEFYGTFSAPVTIANCIAWGNGVDDFRIKGGGPGLEHSLARNNVGVTSTWSVRTVAHNLVGGRNAYNPDMSPDNVLLRGLDRDREFVDPLNLDYRLQADSTLRAANPETPDRGPFPYAPIVFFLRPDGDDAADGLSVRGAWQTLERALRELKAGDTLYLLAGVYAMPDPMPALNGTAGQPIRIRGRGQDRVAIEGVTRLAQSAFLVMERLHFTGTVLIEEGEALTFSHCRFSGVESGVQAVDVTGLRITHCDFSGFVEAAVSLDGGQDVFLAGNRFANAPGRPAVFATDPGSIVYSDYNGYQDRDSAWPQGMMAQMGGDRYAFALAREPPVADAADASMDGLEGRHACGPLGKPAGPFPTVPPAQPVSLSGPFVHSTTDTTANIEWWTSRPGFCEVAWGKTPETLQTETVYAAGFATFSLSGLTPGEDYILHVRHIRPDGRPAYMRAEHTTFTDAALHFRTRSRPDAPRVLHVAADGSDSADGMRPQTAWRTLNRAALEARAGDTVRVGAGVYPGTLWIRGTGEAGRPVIWKAAAGERVVLDGLQHNVTRAVWANAKQHLHFDGFYLRHFGLGEGMDGPLPTGGFVLTGCDNIRLTRCFKDGRGGYSSSFIAGSRSRHVTVRNCVIAACFQGIQVYNFEHFTLAHNVFLMNSIAAAIIGNRADQPIRFHHNIVTDSLPIKRGVQLFEIPHIDAITQSDNCFFLRVPPEQRAQLALFYQSAGRVTLPEWFALKGAHGSQAGNPRFAAMPELPDDAPPDAFIPDLLIRKADLDFADLFVTDPTLRDLGVGLEPAAFEYPSKRDSAK